MSTISVFCASQFFFNFYLMVRMYYLKLIFYTYTIFHFVVNVFEVFILEFDDFLHLQLVTLGNYFEDYCWILDPNASNEWFR